MADNYDTPWKNAVSRYFPEFMAFYFPAAHAGIDWDQPVEFLDQELAQLAPGAVVGPRRVDKLVRVCKLSQPPAPAERLLVHVEVQNWPGRDFAERMFIYNYRIYDRYQCAVASMAVTADSGKRPPPGHFGFEAFGCGIWLDFPAVPLAKYAQDLDTLLQDENPFALLTAAHILALRTRHKHSERYAGRLLLIKRLYEHEWDGRRTMDFMRAIAWMMRLPPSLEAILLEEARQLRKEGKVDYLMPFEREALERGRQQGFTEGKEEGIRLGQVQVLERLLARRFGSLPAHVRQQLHGADSAQLAAWADALLQAGALNDLFGQPLQV